MADIKNERENERSVVFTDRERTRMQTGKFSQPREKEDGRSLWKNDGGMQTRYTRR